MTDVRPTGAGPNRSTEDMAAGEGAKMRDLDLDVQLDDRLARLRDHLVAAFPGLEVSGFRGELTLFAEPAQLVDLLGFSRDDPDVRCELLADLSGVHWPGGPRVESGQETTGWPSYATGEEQGRIEVDYVLYSYTHNHRFRVRVSVPDDAARLPTATAVYSSADFMEREAWDMFGVVFEGHPNLQRILMPEDWQGHPQRKDYPLGGVEIMYKGKTVLPPDERHY